MLTVKWWLLATVLLGAGDPLLRPSSSAAPVSRAAAAPYPESYRYDGLEAGGALRYAGRELTLTSDPRHISLVLYRRDRSSRF